MSTKYKQYRDYLRSDHWLQLRRLKKREVGAKCQHCGSVSSLHVHHIRYRNYHDCTTSDLVVLTETCHDDLHMAIKRNKLNVEDCELPQIIKLIDDYRLTSHCIKRRERIRTGKRERAQQRSQKPNPGKLFRRIIRNNKRNVPTREQAIEIIKRLQAVLSEWPDPIISLLCEYSAEDSQRLSQESK